MQSTWTSLITAALAALLPVALAGCPTMMAAGCVQSAERLGAYTEPAIEFKWGIFGGGGKVSTAVEGDVNASFDEAGKITALSARLVSDPVAVMDAQARRAQALEATRDKEFAFKIESQRIFGENAKIVMDGLSDLATKVPVGDAWVILARAAGQALANSTAAMTVSDDASLDVDPGGTPEPGGGPVGTPTSPAAREEETAVDGPVSPGP